MVWLGWWCCVSPCWTARTVLVRLWPRSPSLRAEEGAPQPLCASRAGGELDLMRKSIVKLERLIFHLQRLKTDASSLICRSHAAATSLGWLFPSRCLAVGHVHTYRRLSKPLKGGVSERVRHCLNVGGFSLLLTHLLFKKETEFKRCRAAGRVSTRDLLPLQRCLEGDVQDGHQEP